MCSPLLATTGRGWHAGSPDLYACAAMAPGFDPAPDVDLPDATLEEWPTYLTSAKAARKPATVIRPISSGAWSNASGIIVSATIASKPPVATAPIAVTVPHRDSDQGSVAASTASGISSQVRPGSASR